jgi:hypothetical protein
LTPSPAIVIEDVKVFVPADRFEIESLISVVEHPESVKSLTLAPSLNIKLNEGIDELVEEPPEDNPNPVRVGRVVSILMFFDFRPLRQGSGKFSAIGEFELLSVPPFKVKAELEP